MKKRSFYKSLNRTLFKSKARFLSILAIIAIGVGFFAGINATQPDMVLSADKYYQDQHLEDFRVLSPLGFTPEDVMAVKSLPGIAAVQESYIKDLFLTSSEGNTAIVKLYSYDETDYQNDQGINKLRLLEGRMPEKPGEIVTERGMGIPEIALNSQVTLSVQEDQELSDFIKNDTYTVVGFIASPVYINFERGQTNVGNGSIDCVAYIPEEDFVMEKPTDLLIRTKESSELQAYSDAYDEHLKPIKEALKTLGKDTMSSEIAKLQDDVDAGYEELDTFKAMVDFMTDEAQKVVALEQIEASEKELKEAQTQINKIPDEWYIFNRNDHPGYAGYGDDSDRIGAVAKVFPVFFFIVAALVCLTTMTRMVEEERVEIGTMKALGYKTLTIASKYLIYALLSSLMGALLGLTVGFWLFPNAIMNAYNIMYDIPVRITIYHFDYAVISIGMAVVTTVSASLVATLEEVKATPAVLLQPKAPKPGKRILLERITPLWRRLSFLHKVTARNLFRYKQRFLMTVIGISGCTGLLLTGFGLKNSINDIMEKQFTTIFIYDGQLMLNTDKEPTERNLEVILGEDPQVKDYIQVYSDSVNASSDEVNRSYDVNLLVPEDAQAFKNFVDLHERKSKETIDLRADGAVITEKLSRMLKVRVGDSITYREPDNTTYTIKVAAISENYMSHYIFMSPEYYGKVIGEGVEYNSSIFNLKNPTTIVESTFKEELMKNEGVLGVMLTAGISSRVMDSMESLDYVVVILIISAGALAFVVLYNLTNINITERIREIATIKVLGFWDKEVSAYVYRENMLLTIIGTSTGLILGFFLHKYVIGTMEIDTMMFGQEVHLISYLYAIVLTMIFTLLVNFFMYFKLQHVNMVESLKSVE